MPFGVCVFPQRAPNLPRLVVVPDYVHVILGHAGLAYRRVDPERLTRELRRLRLLLTVGDADLAAQDRARLSSWVAEGGIWISIAGLCGLPEIFGLDLESPACPGAWGSAPGVTLGEGYSVAAKTSYPAAAGLARPLHHFGGLAVRAAGADVLATVLDRHQRPTERVSVAEHRVGKGRTLFVAADVTGSVVRVQQGFAITRDGVSSPDGLAGVCDGVLKSDDGAVLDWDFDRDPVPAAPGLRAFLDPVADRWRELLLRTIFHAAGILGLRVPLLWLYPRRLPALAHMSHDSDNNDPRLATMLLETLAQLGIRSTWCIIPPGYPRPVIHEIRAAGHELAMHFDTMSGNGVWSRRRFTDQHRRLSRLFDGRPPVTNKNHFLRWEGDCDLWHWCAETGVLLDQSKGASKPGEAGFNFGTCHPYVPVDPAGSLLDVLELATPTQDLAFFAPVALLEPLLDAATRHHGILHLLFHPAHIERNGVAAAISHASEQAGKAGLEWWTASEISRWERARRSTRWSSWSQTQDGVRVALNADSTLEESTLLFLGNAGQPIRIGKREHEAVPMTCWGFPFDAVQITLEPETPVTLRIADPSVRRGEST